MILRRSAGRGRAPASDWALVAHHLRHPGLRAPGAVHAAGVHVQHPQRVHIEALLCELRPVVSGLVKALPRDSFRLGRFEGFGAATSGTKFEERGYNERAVVLLFHFATSFAVQLRYVKS